VGLNVGSNTVNAYINSTSFAIGNSTVNTAITSTTITSTALLSIGNTNVTGTANVSTGINVGANVNLSTSQINVGNSTVNTVISAASLTTTSNTVSLGTAAYVVANGNVGVNTSSPGSKLDILRSSTTTAVFDESLIRAINTGAATLNQRVDIGMRFQDGTYNGIGGISMIRESATARSGGLSFSSIGSDGNPTNAMRLDSSGNLGIGTTSPSANYGRLTVSGTGITITADTSAKLQIGRYGEGAPFSYIKMGSTSSGLKITDPTDSYDLMTITSAGNLGVGNTSPSYKLEVTGTAHISSYAYIDSLVSGYIPHTGVIGWGYTVGGSQTIAKLKWGSYGRIQHTSFGNIPFLSFNAELYESDFTGSGSGQSNRNYFRPDYNLGQYAILSHGNGGVAFNVGNWSSNNSISLSAFSDHTSYAGGVLPTGNWEIKNSIGIGTNTPDAKLSIISEAGGGPMLQIRNFSTTATGAFLGTYAAELRTASTGATVHGVRIHLNEANNDRRTLDVADYNGVFATFVNGNVGIGTVYPSTKLTVAKVIDSAAYGSGTRMIDFKSFYPGYDVDTVKASLYAGVDNTGTLNTASGYFAIQTSLAGTLYERLRINSLGNVLIGTTTTTDANQALLVLQSSYPKTRMEIRNDGQTAGLYAITFYNANGLIGNITPGGSGTAYNTTSDYRLKRDVQPMTGALTKILAIKPVTYKWKADGSDGQGFIAHELAEVCPDAVTGVKDEVNEDGAIKPQGVDTSFLVATLTAAIQEQQALITQLQAEVAELKSR
jgi:hypothetical protein